MRKIVPHVITFGLVTAVGTEFIQHGLEPSGPAQMHIEIENYGPFQMPTSIPWIASGERMAVPANRIERRFETVPQIGGDARIKVEII